MFAWKICADSRINIGFGTTAVQKCDEFVFVLSPECSCDWGGLPVFGVIAAPYPVPGVTPHDKKGGIVVNYCVPLIVDTGDCWDCGNEQGLQEHIWTLPQITRRELQCIRDNGCDVCVVAIESDNGCILHIREKLESLYKKRMYAKMSVRSAYGLARRKQLSQLVSLFDIYQNCFV